MNLPGYYTTFDVPSSLAKDCPCLYSVLESVFNDKYHDLYDDHATKQIEDAVLRVLAALESEPSLPIKHLRYVYMAYTLMLSVEDTLTAYNKDLSSFYYVKEIIESFICDPSIEIDVNKEIQALFPYPNKITAYMAVDGANDVIYHALECLDLSKSTSSICNILYEATTGDAISGFAVANRFIFNWCINEVIPSSYYLSVPRTLFSFKWQYPSLFNYKVNKDFQDIDKPNTYIVIGAYIESNKIHTIYVYKKTEFTNIHKIVINSNELKLVPSWSGIPRITHIPIIGGSTLIINNNELISSLITNNSLVPGLWQALESII